MSLSLLFAVKYKESDLNISFDPSWRVKKFDASRYFKLLSGLGLKGVDFIALDKSGQLFLIEVKNYKKRLKSPVDPDISDLIGKSPNLKNHFVQKVEDSCQLLEVIYKYLNRKWFYRLMFKYRHTIPKAWIENSEWTFWFDANHLLANPNNLNCVLLLELERAYPTFKREELSDLPKNLLGDFKKVLEERFKSIEILNLSQWHDKYYKN